VTDLVAQCDTFFFFFFEALESSATGESEARLEGRRILLVDAMIRQTLNG
jgi:hypothetical protein